MLIWVTRTAPDNFLTARRLKDLGHRALLNPTLRTTPVANEPLDFAPRAILFTSANGVRHHRMQAELAHVPVYAVGSHASDLAVERGYRTVTSTAGDAEMVKALISLALPAGSIVAHYAAREVADLLPKHIRDQGHECRQIVVYHAEALGTEPTRRVIGAVDGIVVHSAKGAAPVAALVRATGWRGEVWALSEACAAPFAGLGGVRTWVAPLATEGALMSLIPDPAGTARRRAGANADLLRSAMHESDSDGSAGT